MPGGGRDIGEESVAARARGVPLGRLVEAEDIANAVLFFLSPQAARPSRRPARRITGARAFQPAAAATWTFTSPAPGRAAGSAGKP